MSDRHAVQIPGLQVLGELGRGARSVVYRARRGDFVVALKLPSGPQDAAAAKLFRREAVTLASVAHPCLPQVYEVGEVDGLPYVIRELAEGPSLASKLVHGPLPEVEVAALGRQLAQALAAIHRRLLVHREVAPYNVLRVGDEQMDPARFDAAPPPADESAEENADESVLSGHDFDPSDYKWLPVLRRPRSDGWTPQKARPRRAPEWPPVRLIAAPPESRAQCAHYPQCDFTYHFPSSSCRLPNRSLHGS